MIRQKAKFPAQKNASCVDTPGGFPHIPRPRDPPVTLNQVFKMVSNTRHTQTRREIRAKSAGTATKRARAKAGTPAFPIHPEGYDPKSADAKPSKA